MSHNIQVVVGRNLKKFSSKWKSVKLISLPQNIYIIPLTHELSNEINQGQSKPKRALNDYFDHLSQSLFELLKLESRNGQIGFIEAEYFGGMGTQSAILFMNEQTIGPFKTENLNRKEEMAINKILSMLGVKKEEFTDEFAVIGFANVRNNRDLIEKYSS